MEKRIDYPVVAPKGLQAFSNVREYLMSCGLESGLLHLVFLRVSQINGCAYCVDLHFRDALRAGLGQRKLNSLVTWADGPFFTERERAALAWAESLTLVAQTHAPDDTYRSARSQFADKELVDLTYAIALMNAFNRLSVAFRHQPDVDADGR